MLDAVNDSIRVLSRNVPAPYIGLLSFGTDVLDTGVAPAGGCPSGFSNCRVPDVQLTDTSSGVGALIDNGGTLLDRTDDVPKMRTTIAATNLSLGIAIAGSELMGKYYPNNGLGDANSGLFEDIVANNRSFSSLLPPQPGGGNDRPDSSFKDVIVVVTDGAPNGIITHVSGQTWYRSVTLGLADDFDFINPTQHLYRTGEVKLFRTPSNGSGSLIVDNNNVAADGTLVSPSNLYRYCNDNLTSQPSNILSPPNNTNLFNTVNSSTRYRARMPMCNATLIANKLKNDEGISIIAVYVYNDSAMTEAQARATPEAEWLANDFVTRDSSNQPLLGLIGNYDQLVDTIMTLFEQLELIESR
jgi:hypothetical protein